jgi:molecular chaperone GrpE
MEDERDDRLTGAQAEGAAESEVEILDIAAVDENGDTRTDPIGPEPEALAAGPEPGPSAAAAELDELRSRYLRLLADFDNFRKRADRERTERVHQALAESLRELLPVVDNLERAVAAAGRPEDLRQGVEMTARGFLEALRRLGVEEVPGAGSPFDPREHEAVSRVASEDVEGPTVVEVFQRGYRLGGRLLRPAMVRVAVPPEEPPPAAVETPE